MKFGVNTFVWISPCTTMAVRDLAPKVKAMGFDILEISVENPDLINVKLVNEILKENKLEGIICGAFGPDRNICSNDPRIRENAKTYIHWLIDAAHEIGSEVICGPMYSSVGKNHLEDSKARKQEWDLSVSGIREMADYASTKSVKLAFEPLNRFETDMINVVSFHMHLEEKSSPEAIRLAGKKIFHFHACENDRGVPGTGQVHWNAIGDALKETGYTGPVVIESFTDQVKEIARAVCIWREIAPSQDAIASQGLNFLRTLLA
jgi:D-psicose/D-tagatose/L-ribulose 3-epimerase